MFIGLYGGTCSGKHAIESFLVDRYNFKRLRIGTQLPSKDANSFKEAETTTYFASFDQLYDFVTRQFDQNLVTTDVCDEKELDQLFLRPFFLLIHVDAPIGLRWHRYQSRCESLGISSGSLEGFIGRNDEDLFSKRSSLARTLERAQMRLVNTSSSLTDLYAALEKLDLSNEQRLRPTWDQYFMQLASLAAQRSNCMKRRVGCVLVRDRRVVSTGYNGTPRGLKNCSEGGCARCNSGLGKGHALSTCLCLHAEENALLEAGRERIREGASLYCNTCPCLTCSIKITQVGISEVIYQQGYNMDEEAAGIFRDGGVKLRQFSPPRQGLIPL